MERFNISFDLYLGNTIILNRQCRLIPTDISDFQAEGRFGSADFAVPELLGFGAIKDDVAVYVDFDFGVGAPLTLGGGAIEAEKLVLSEALLADLDGLFQLIHPNRWYY